jgi:hypothetical protein
MPTVAEIVNIYPIALYLASIDIPKKGLSGGGDDIALPEKIFSIGESVLYRYNQNPTDSTLTDTANFLYAIMGKYGLKAMAVNGSSGSIAHVNTAQVHDPYNFIVNSSDTLLQNGQSSVIITAFIGYNISFSRNSVPQSNINTEPSYYTWNKQSGLFTVNPAATSGELFIIAAI